MPFLSFHIFLCYIHTYSGVQYRRVRKLRNLKPDRISTTYIHTACMIDTESTYIYALKCVRGSFDVEHRVLIVRTAFKPWNRLAENHLFFFSDANSITHLKQKTDGFQLSLLGSGCCVPCTRNRGQISDYSQNLCWSMLRTLCSTRSTRMYVFMC
jgi:hypothetical protein